MLRGWFMRSAGVPSSLAPAVVFVHGWPWNRLGNRAGSSLLPDIYGIVEQRFGRDRVRAWQPFEAVAYGGCVFAAGAYSMAAVRTISCAGCRHPSS